MQLELVSNSKAKLCAAAKKTELSQIVNNNQEALGLVHCLYVKRPHFLAAICAVMTILSIAYEWTEVYPGSIKPKWISVAGTLLVG